jgi:hypothetical protein
VNIFYLSNDVVECAEMHCDKHTVKMIVEYAQILSTAHRVLDGNPEKVLSDSGRRLTKYILDDNRDKNLYSATHINHPSTAWARKSYHNYVWLSKLLFWLAKEYTHRYEKTHLVERSGLLCDLLNVPNHLSKTITHSVFTEPPPAMPDKYKVVNNSISSYRNYYIHEKASFASWKKREVPNWFSAS